MKAIELSVDDPVEVHPLREELRYYCDDMRHLVCVPYTVENLHRMAEDLGIKRCWFHRGSKHPHYDIPKRRIEEVRAKCTVVSPREVLKIMKGERR